MTSKCRLSAALSGLVLASSWIAVPAGAGDATQASWAKAANAVCANWNAQIRAMPRVTSSNVLSNIRALLSSGRLAGTRLSAIPRPASESERIGKLLNIFWTQATLFAQIGSALERGDSATASRLGAKNDKLNVQFNALALTLRARTCAENPQPGG